MKRPDHREPFRFLGNVIAATVAIAALAAWHIGHRSFAVLLLAFIAGCIFTQLINTLVE